MQISIKTYNSDNFLKIPEINNMGFSTDFQKSNSECHAFLVAKMDDNIVGVVTMYIPKIAKNLDVSFFEVKKEYRDCGIATKMSKELFELAKKNNRSISTGGLSDDGKQYLDKVLTRYSKKTGVEYAVVQSC